MWGPLVILMTKSHSHHSLPLLVSISMPCMGVCVRWHLLLPGIGITLMIRGFLATPACGRSSSIAWLFSSWRAWVHGYSRDTSPYCSGWLFTPCSYTSGSSVRGVLLRLLEACPWDYSHFEYNLIGLVTLEYAVPWAMAALLAEKHVIRNTLKIRLND